MNNIPTTNHPTICTFLFLHVVGLTASLVNCKDGHTRYIKQPRRRKEIKPLITPNLRKEIRPEGHIFEPITDANHKTLAKIS